MITTTEGGQLGIDLESRTTDWKKKKSQEHSSAEQVERQTEEIGAQNALSSPLDYGQNYQWLTDKISRNLFLRIHTGFRGEIS